MELIQTIALLCQIGTGCTSDRCLKFNLRDVILPCQQSYLNCVLKRNTMTQAEALQRCILEK